MYAAILNSILKEYKILCLFMIPQYANSVESGLNIDDSIFCIGHQYDGKWTNDTYLQVSNQVKGE